MQNLNKQLQIAIGNAISKDYFKLEDGVKVQLELYSSWTNEGSDTEYSSEPEIFETGIILNGEVLGNKNGNLTDMNLEEKDFKNGVYTYGVDENGGISVEEYEKVEILGQEPTFQDLLLAIGKIQYLTMAMKDDVTLVLRQYIGKWSPEQWQNFIEIDLTKSLFNQTPECKSSILSMLNNK